MHIRYVIVCFLFSSFLQEFLWVSKPPLSSFLISYPLNFQYLFLIQSISDLLSIFPFLISHRTSSLLIWLVYSHLSMFLENYISVPLNWCFRSFTDSVYVKLSIQSSWSNKSIKGREQIHDSLFKIWIIVQSHIILLVCCLAYFHRCWKLL